MGSIFVDSGSTAKLFGPVTLTGSTTVSVGGLLEQSATIAPTLSISSVAAGIGATLTATISTEPGSPVFLYGGFPTTSLTPVAGFAPGAVLPLGSLLLLGGGVASGAGTFDVPVTLPASPVLAGTLLATQAVAVGAAAGTSNGSLIRVGF